jgi:hypothetical protein
MFCSNPTTHFGQPARRAPAAGCKFCVRTPGRDCWIIANNAEEAERWVQSIGATLASLQWRKMRADPRLSRVMEPESEPEPEPEPEPNRATAQRDRSRSSLPSHGCQVEMPARKFFETLRIDPAYLEPQHDRCYCERCYPAEFPDTIANKGPTEYVVPRGWFRFGLKLQPRGQDAELDIFNKWSVSFHGTKSPLVLKSVLQCGQLMKAGDILLDGTTLHSAKCARRQDKVFYTSPTIKYAGLKFYAEPQRVGGGRRASIALQCRQKPGSFETQGETMRFAREMPGHLGRACPHVDLRTIEWKSGNNVAAIPYGLLIRTFGADDNGYRSPLDPR